MLNMLIDTIFLKLVHVSDLKEIEAYFLFIFSRCYNRELRIFIKSLV